MIDGKVVRRELTEGRPALLAVDMQGPCDQPTVKEPSVPLMEDYAQRTRAAVALIQRARACGIPVIFLREVHRRNGVDYVITKRRYSCFFGTDLEILLRGLEVDTLILVGSLTNVCIH